VPVLADLFEVASTLPHDGWLFHVVDELNDPTLRSCVVGGLEWPQL
jgi:hypothetical protein